MTKSSFIFFDSLVFLLIGSVHLVRVLMGWEVTIGSYMVPMWPSWIAIVLALYLAFQGFMLTEKA